jgi:hypothetical protein
MEFESTPHDIEFLETLWPLTLAVDEGGFRLTPIEFTTDPEAARLNQAIQANSSFEQATCEALRSLKLETTFGLIALKVSSHPDLEFVEYNPGFRKSILKETLSSSVDRKTLIETCWRVPLMEAEMDCEASCFARCFVTDEGHSGDHAPAHNPNG